VVDSYDDCLETHGVLSRLKAQMDFHELNNSRVMIRAIELNKEKNNIGLSSLVKECRS
jgi:hypothetical protein